MTSVYIGSSGIVFPMDGGFYPEDMKDSKLMYYSSIFDTVCIKSTFFGSTLNRDTYELWIDQISHNDRFKFIITAPKTLTFCKDKEIIKGVWSRFWSGPDNKGGCDILSEANRLGCVLVEFPLSFSCTITTRKRLDWYLKMLSKYPVNVALEFKNISWWIDDALTEIEPIFKKYPGLGIAMVIPCLENRIVNAGWAGSMFSTTFNSTPSFSIPGNFTFIKMYGALGEFVGSYDEGEKMENIVKLIDHRAHVGEGDVFCLFSNTDSTICRPLPAIMFNDCVVWPDLRSLPYYSNADIPSCLHDAQRLKHLWDNRELTLDSEGFVTVTFQG